MECQLAASRLPLASLKRIANPLFPTRAPRSRRANRGYLTGAGAWSTGNGRTNWLDVECVGTRRLHSAIHAPA